MGMRGWLHLAALVLLAAPAQARDKDGNYAVYSPTCEELNAGAKDPNIRNAVNFWLQGFLSGFNYAKDETWDILRENSLTPVIRELFSYCEGNAQGDLAAAAEAMVQRNWPLRYRELPKD